MKSVILLAICLCISSVDCIDCSKVVVDGQYINLSVYSEDWVNYHNWMYNWRAHKWEFTISFDDNSNGSDVSDGVIDHFGQPIEFYQSGHNRYFYYR